MGVTTQHIVSLYIAHKNVSWIVTTDKPCVQQKKETHTGLEQQFLGELIPLRICVLNGELIFHSHELLSPVAGLQLFYIIKMSI